MLQVTLNAMLLTLKVEGEADRRDGEAEAANSQSSSDAETDPDVERADHQQDHDADDRLQTVQQ